MDQRLAPDHTVAFGNQDIADDAAFQMRDRLAVALDPDGAQRDGRTFKARRRRPDAAADQENRDHGPAQAMQPGDLTIQGRGVGAPLPDVPP